MANVNDNETQSTTSKLLTLANLARYNHSVCEKLGLTQDTLAYVKNAQATDSPTTVAAALNDLYSKAAAAEKLNKTATSSGGTYVTLTATAQTSSNSDGTLEFVVNDALLNDTFVKKADVDITDTTVSNWGDSTTLKVDDKTLTITLPDNPIAGGATETKNGITVSIANGTAEPTLTVTPGSIATGDTSVVTGGAVYAAIEDAKAEDKYVTVDNQSITSEGGLISGTLAITSNKEGGSASLSVNPTLTTSSSAATAIATKEYVDEKAAAEKTVYSFGDNTSFSKVEGKEEYTVTVPLMSKVGSADATEVDNIVLTLDSSEFVKDSFLQDAKMGTDDKADYLILTMKLADGTTKDIDVDLSKFIDIYTAADKSIDITENKIKVNLDGGYLKLNANGIGIDTTKLQGYAASEAATGDNNIATKKYVDDTAKNSSVTATTTGNIEAFGDSNSITIKTGANDTVGTTFTVSLPSFTGNADETDKVKVSIENDGTISVDEKVLNSAIEEASNNFKGKTTLGLYGEGATGDLADGDVEITIGGDGAAANQKVTIKDTRAAKADQELSGPTEAASFGGTQTITLSKVAGENATTATITIPELTATSGNSTSENVSVGLTNGTITVATEEQGATNTATYDNTKLAQAGYVDEKFDSVNVKNIEDGENKFGTNIPSDVNGGIYVTSSNGTFTVGAVVATDGEIDAIFDGTHTA